MKEEILNHLNDNEIKSIDIENIGSITIELQNEELIMFSIGNRTGDDNMDYWTQIEYYSDKIQKTIIWNYDTHTYFETLEDFAKHMENINQDIITFERHLILHKPNA